MFFGSFISRFWKQKFSLQDYVISYYKSDEIFDNFLKDGSFWANIS